jgi:hypothetical protein
MRRRARRLEGTMAKGPKPFKYRDKWRATVTLSNRTRPTKHFKKYDDAVQWITEQLANADSLCFPELGGPTLHGAVTIGPAP